MLAETLQLLGLVARTLECLLLPLSRRSHAGWPGGPTGYRATMPGSCVTDYGQLSPGLDGDS